MALYTILINIFCGDIKSKLSSTSRSFLTTKLIFLLWQLSCSITVTLFSRSLKVLAWFHPYSLIWISHQWLAGVKHGSPSLKLNVRPVVILLLLYSQPMTFTGIIWYVAVGPISDSTVIQIESSNLDKDETKDTAPLIEKKKDKKTPKKVSYAL